MSNTAPAKQVRKPKKLPFVIMCILSAIVAVLNVLLCVLVPKYYTTINSFLYKGPDADEVAAFRQASADMTQKVESEGIVMLENKNQTLPLASGSKINLFGYGSRDTVYGGSGSGSSSHSGGDKYHFGAVVQLVADVFYTFFGGVACPFGTVAGSKSLCDATAQLQFHRNG